MNLILFKNFAHFVTCCGTKKSANFFDCHGWLGIILYIDYYSKRQRQSAYHMYSDKP